METVVSPVTQTYTLHNHRRGPVLGVPKKKSKLKFIPTFYNPHAPLFSQLDVVAFWFLIGERNLNIYTVLYVT